MEKPAGLRVRRIAGRIRRFLGRTQRPVDSFGKAPDGEYRLVSTSGEPLEASGILLDASPLDGNFRLLPIVQVFEETSMNGTFQAGTGISNLRAFLIALTVVACGGSLSVAAYAWLTHFWWTWTGAYAGNSFPMGAFAVDASRVAGYVCLASAVIWAAVLLWDRNLSRAPGRR
jgi:hypothetical protein